MSADTRKLIFVIFYETLLFVLMLTGKITSDTALPLMTAMGGYVVGNGYNSLKGRISTPVFVPKELPPPEPINTERKGPE